ncbi:cyclin-P3-1-like [Macadamia integrifolia]|uniref:cyclin-P3-1-like n=1 Tax=Macadamia integrifolia TaxID=60698 RepID=UPI001C52EDB3|nr:cyclin-P3-1-like [Macadamia integrifolia]
MGTVTPDSEAVGSEIYSSLGIIKLAKVPGNYPRVLSLLSSLLERCVQKNEKLLDTTKKKDTVTTFHGLRVPSLGIRKYIDRIFKYSCCSPSCFVIAYIYIDRFIQRMDVHLTSLNVHRLIITSVMVAAKFFDDAFFNNAYYARVGGVSTSEMNRLEMKFLFGLDFRLHVTVTTFEWYGQLLEKEGDGYQIERPIQICGLKESWPNKDDAKRAVATVVRYSC